MAAFRLSVVLILALLAPGVAPAQSAADAMIDRNDRRILAESGRAEVRRTVEAWKTGRADMIEALVRRGAEQAEAEAAIDQLIAHGETQIGLQAVEISDRVPLLTDLNRRLGVLGALTNLGHRRFQAFAAATGLAVGEDLFQCLCGTYSISGAGIGYHPGETQDCRNADPCKGGNWGCVSHDLPSDAAVWTRCIKATTGADRKPIPNEILDRVSKMQARYDRDICERLRSMVEATAGMIDAKALKPNSKSRMAATDFESSYADWLTGMNFTGMTEVGAGALVDKFDVRVGNLTGWHPFGEDSPTGLGHFLTVGERPSDTGLRNPYVGLTKVLSSKETLDSRGANVNMSLEMRLARRIVRSRGNLDPGEVMKMAVEVTEGDVPLAALVAHNLLKEAAYARRENKPMVLGVIPYRLQSNDPPTARHFAEIRKTYRDAFGDKNAGFAATDFIMAPVTLIDKLQDIRPAYDPHVDDRMGPWYHSFGLVFVGTNPTFGEMSAIGGAALENLTRLFGAGSDRSLGKEAANRCAAQATSMMLRKMAAKGLD